MGCLLGDGGSVAKKTPNPGENLMQLLEVTVKCVLREYSLCLQSIACACRTQRVLGEQSLIINVFHTAFKIICNIQLGAIKRDRYRQGKQKKKPQTRIS